MITVDKWQKTKTSGSAYTAEKTLDLVSKTKKALKEWGSTLAKEGKQERVEQLLGMLEEAEFAANAKKSYDVGPILRLAREIKPSKKPETTCSKCKKLPVLTDGMCTKCLTNITQDRMDAFLCKRSDLRTYASKEQRDEFYNGILELDTNGNSCLREEPINSAFNDAHEAWEGKPSEKTYKPLIAALERAEQFFATVEIPDSSNEAIDDEEEEEEEEDDYSESSEEIVTKKRPREDVQLDVMQAMLHGTDDERKQMVELRENGETKRLRAIVDDITARNITRYQIVYFQKSNGKLYTLLNNVDDPFFRRDLAESRADQVLGRNQTDADLDYRIEIINGQ